MLEKSGEVFEILGKILVKKVGNYSMPAKNFGLAKTKICFVLLQEKLLVNSKLEKNFARINI